LEGEAHSFSDWTEASVAIIAVLKGNPIVAKALFTGFMASKHLLLNGVCSIVLGPVCRTYTHKSVSYLLHTRLFMTSIVLTAIPTLARLADQSELLKQALTPADKADTVQQPVFALSIVTAMLLLLSFLVRDLLLCGIHWRQMRLIQGQERETADFDAFARLPTAEVSPYIACRIQDYRDTYQCDASDDMCKHDANSSSATNSGTPRNAAVLCIVLAGACILISGSSLFLIESLEPGWILSEQTMVFLIISAGLLTDCTAAFISEGKHTNPAAIEHLNLSARRSTAHLLAVVVPSCVVMGWVFRADSLLMPLDVLSHAIWAIGLLMQIIGEGW
jgi:Ca2+/H+ antiporter